MGVVQINKSIKIIDKEVLEITKFFAENNLSKACLDYADYKNDKYYEWTIGSTAYAVIFELPQVFNAHIQDAYSMASFYCPDYLEQAGITSDNFIQKYKKNYNKKIKFQ